MKYNGDYDKTITIQQHEGGYVIMDVNLGGFKTKIVSGFEEMCDELAMRFGLKDVGERIVLGATKERKEKPAAAPEQEGER
jgi:hypothetical protein